MLFGVQIDHLGLDFWAILHDFVDFLRKGCMGLFSTTRTGFDFSTMFRDLHLHFRQIEHLPPLMPDRFSPPQRLTTMLTFVHMMDFNKVWLFDGFQRFTQMPLLTTPFAPGSFAQTFRAGCSLIVSVAGRRLPAV